jgi:hypothetical protein
MYQVCCVHKLRSNLCSRVLAHAQQAMLALVQRLVLSCATNTRPTRVLVGVLVSACRHITLPKTGVQPSRCRSANHRWRLGTRGGTRVFFSNGPLAPGWLRGMWGLAGLATSLATSHCPRPSFGYGGRLANPLVSGFNWRQEHTPFLLQFACSEAPSLRTV